MRNETTNETRNETMTEELWQYAARKTAEWQAVPASYAARNKEYRDETARITARYIALRIDGQSKDEALAKVREEEDRPRMDVAAWSDDDGDLNELQKMWG